MQLEELASTAARFDLAGKGVSGQAQLMEAPQAARDATVIPTVPDIPTDTGADQAADELDQVIEEMREYQGWGNFDIDFDRDEQTNALIVRIVDRDTGKTLRQIPPDQILRLRQHLREALGLVFDRLA